MTELQQSRYDQLLRRVGDLKGPGSKVNDALSELFPMFDVENVPGELLLLGGTILGQGSTTMTGAALEVPRIQLFNPVNSGKIVTCTTMLAGANQLTIIRTTVNQTALTTGVGTELSRDGRIPATSRPVAQIRTLSSVANTDATIQFRVNSGFTQQLTDPNGLAVLPPGSGYEVGGSIITGTINVAFFWRERVAEPSELNF